METDLFRGLGFRVTFLGVPIIRTIVFLGLYWGPPILGNYHLSTGWGIKMLHGKGFVEWICFPEFIILKEWRRSTQPTVQKIIARLFAKVLRGLLSSTHVPQLFQSEHYVACLRSYPTTRLRSFENDDIRELSTGPHQVRVVLLVGSYRINSHMWARIQGHQHQLR